LKLATPREDGRLGPKFYLAVIVYFNYDFFEGFRYCKSIIIEVDNRV